ncbi:hypothetical protein [Streptomyces sp. NBC_00258]|uniref:hypothetical protein n=1 Tax=Streptomyces sp. NBC_00258 TaxID=2903642 RepID=UPI002E291DD0|nr:hypothetical protein [Streptomyces sp. NBC_00258]
MGRRRARWLGMSAALVLAVGGLSSASPAVAAVVCPSGVESDFNGDGQRDVAIADPEATVAGHADAGAVHVVYGSGKGNLLTVSE